MGTKRILVDTLHEEQTRVALLNGNQIEDFELEITAKKPLKGNIYLARIARIEPSLQAAFVEYGGNRHGFLPFSEIHPDYFLISDKERAEIQAFYDQKKKRNSAIDLESSPVSTEDEDENLDHFTRVKEVDYEDFEQSEDEMMEEEGSVEKFTSPHRRFQIQDVLKRRQIILVQVTKEERGNKGAALTTYLSIAGRYCVLMPNTNHTGGVSRRIASVGDRRRLRDILNGLSIADDMAVIVRTAGSKRSKLDIQRDYEYLLRVWENIRKRAFESFACTLIYEEANLIKRTIRDMYSQEISEILIAGDKGYESAKELMSLLIPNRLNKLRKYEDQRVSLFQRWGTEKDITHLMMPEVMLPSGGYLVINPTEALIAVDVNSGKATSESSVEDTALATNLEAADELARQLRLRNLAGLVVVDFIDMEVGRHRAKVERRMKEALSKDRSRVQIGKISPFGLLELSRQRTSPSFLESVATTCSCCSGIGVRETLESAGLQLLRSIEAEIHKNPTSMLVFASDQSTLWILNEKRPWLHHIEKKFDIRISFVSDGSLHKNEYRIERIRTQEVATSQHVTSGTAIEEIEDNHSAIEPLEEEKKEKGQVKQPAKKRRRKSRYADRKNKQQEKIQEKAQEPEQKQEKSQEKPQEKSQAKKSEKIEIPIEKPKKKNVEPKDQKKEKPKKSKIEPKKEDQEETKSKPKKTSATKKTQSKPKKEKQPVDEQKSKAKIEPKKKAEKPKAQKEVKEVKEKKVGWWQR